MTGEWTRVTPYWGIQIEVPVPINQSARFTVEVRCSTDYATGDSRPTEFRVTRES